MSATTLTPGTRLGPFEIVSTLGEGGMGAVYRARDTKLSREVAIKVLLQAVANDADRLARFQREAQVLASLNHPHIAAIYGLEDADGTKALVLELVEGEDLAQRIARGPIPLDEALPIAKQIADALEAAHEQGIIHRDLKPANIKVRPDGTVKVLDFGLAKAMDPAGASSANAMNSPTLSMHATQAGIILGTAAYMAPEQARGKAVDKRADIWAFGCVLYEMLSGKRAFAGDDITDTLTAVMRDTPDFGALPASTPPPVRSLMERCLERDLKLRLRDIGEARIILGHPSALSGTASAASRPVTAAMPLMRSPRMWAALAAVALLSGAIGVWASARLRPPSATSVTRFSIPLPAGQVLAGRQGPAVSRDGGRIAYAANGPDGLSHLYVRSLDQLTASVIPDSEGAQDPFFSPDGSRVGFFARKKLLTAMVSGGPPTAIADASFFPYGATWREDDTIVFVHGLSSGLLRVPSAGGKPQRLTETDDADHGYANVWPQFLPGGRSVLFTTWGGKKDGVSVVSMETGAVTSAERQHDQHAGMSGGWSSRYASSGHLLVSGHRGVMAVPFDPSRPQVTRAPTYVIDDVFSNGAEWTSWFSVSDAGTLVYVPGDPTLGAMAWVDREGRITPVSDKSASLVNLTLSPDGASVGYSAEWDLWVEDLRRGTRTRLTLDNEGANAYTVWSRDGGRIYFSSNRGGDWDLYSVSASGGSATHLLTRKGTQSPMSVSPDGTLLFADRTRESGNVDLWTLSPDGKVAPLIVSPASKAGAQFSPDGRLVAYGSDENGRDEVYVRSVAKADEGAAVSTDGGLGPKWSPDGKELFYRRGDAFMAAAVSTTGPLRVGAPRKLFDVQAHVGRTVNHAGYAVAPDGRFLILRRDPRAVPNQINVVLNWTEELKAKLPAK